MLDGLISMANSLGLETVGEGIEETAQLTRLREANCRYAQGYLFSRPVPLAELDDRDRDRPRGAPSTQVG